jgi:hypothetical protein
MGASTDEIDRQIKETRDHIDENLGALEQRAASNALRYARIAVMVLGAAALAGGGVLIFRRLRRPNRSEQLRRMVIQALKDLPGSLRDLPEDAVAQLKKPLPSVKVIVNREADLAREPGTLESIVRRVAPAVVGTASSALVDRFTRPSRAADEGSARSTIPAYD